MSSTLDSWFKRKSITPASNEKSNSIKNVNTPPSDSNNNPNQSPSPAKPVFIPKQTVGVSRDRTDVFKQKRLEIANENKQKTKLKLEQLAAARKPAPQTSSNPLSPIFKSLSFSNLKGNTYCLTCGLITRAHPCRLCEQNFCSKCLVKLTEEHLTGILLPTEVLTVCARCRIVVTREETQRKLQIRFKESKQKMAAFVNVYHMMKDTKDLLEKQCVNFEFLASSISDPTTKSKTDIGNIFEDARLLEKQILDLFHRLELLMKEFAVIDTSYSPKLVKMKNNITMIYVEFVQIYLPKFKRLKRVMVGIEMKAINNLYIIVYRLSIENKRHLTFWEKFGNLYSDLLKIIQRDLMDAASANGEQWDNHKAHLDDFLSTWDKHSQPLLNVTDIETEFEGTLTRKNMHLLQECAKKFQGKVGTEASDLLSKQALDALISRLRDTYYSEAQEYAHLKLLPLNAGTSTTSYFDNIVSQQPSEDPDSDLDDWSVM